MTPRSFANGPMVVAIFATLCLAIFLAPMFSALFWSVILAILFWRINERLVARLGTRNRASFATVSIILICVIVPVLLVAVLIANQINLLAGQSDDIAAAIGRFATDWLDHVPASVRLELNNLVESAEIDANDVGKLVLPAIGFTFSMGGNVVYAIGTIFAALYVAFFFLRDGRKIAEYLSRAIPLKAEHKAIMASRLAGTVSATVRGVLLVAAAQAIVAGVIYWLLGLQAFAVLAALTFVGCLIPAIGSGLIWVPVGIYFFATGDPTSGLIMILSGVFLISMIDNILRPRLISERAALPDFLIFLSSFGGLILLGFDGLFLGPIVAAFFVESWNISLGLSGGQVGEEASSVPTSDQPAET